MDPALCELLRNRPEPGHEIVEAIIRLDQPQIDVAGVRIVSRFGCVATCRLRKDAIVRVRCDPNVRSLKWSRPLGAELDAEVEAPARILPLHPLRSDRRRPTNLALEGDGVLVGVVDWGCDPDDWNLKHPDDGTTRLCALWDQRDVGTGPTPQPYGYGTVYTARRINAALRTRDPYETLGYHPAEADRTRRGTHGMHVIDIAAGNGLSGGPVGIAPRASLAFVHLGPQNTSGPANLGDSARILEAVDFIFRLAGDRPCVINLSLGKHGGSHDGCTLTELALDSALASAPNRCVVQSAGNYFGKSIHASGRLTSGSVRSLTLVTHEDDHTPNELEVWYCGDDELLIGVESPTGQRTGWVRLDQCTDIVEDGQPVGRLYHRACDPNSHDNQVELFLYPAAPPGAWVVTLQAARVLNGAFHAWVERDDVCSPCQARFLVADADDTCTTGTIANGHLPLVVGAYDPHSIGHEVGRSSSAGPTRDGRRKPDLVAPGVQVLAARSAPLGTARSPGLLTRKSGTSMAAPHVTGAVALCLQGAPYPLAAKQMRDLVLTSAAPPRTNGAHGHSSSRFGHGYLDIARLLAAVTALGPTGRPGPTVRSHGVQHKAERLLRNSQ